MRYFEFTMNIKYADIKSDKVRLKDYSYDNNIEALTSYLFKNLSNGNSFLIYREDETGLRSLYAIDEKTREPKEALEEIILAVEDVIGKNITTEEPFEITMLDFDTHLCEAKRRGYNQYWSRIVDQAGVLIYDDREAITTGRCGFKLDEAVAGTGSEEDHLFDASLNEELERIRASKKSGKTKDVKAIPAHYVIAARSKEAGIDITQRLMKELSKAGRLQTGRMEFISNIDEELHKHPRLFEQVMENSRGGTIVIDLSGRYGVESTAYAMTCGYLAKWIKEHKNDNLFVFLYDMDKPGFTYYLLPEVKNSLYLVPIREGKGNIRASEDYLKALIKDSELSKYAGQAGEFIETLGKKEFTQTDVIRAYENFESWCIRKNVLSGYNLDLDEEFFMERDSNNMSGYDQLHGLIALDAVKEQIDRIILANKAEKQREKLGSKARSMHMVFTGNPGTCKTEVAKIFAKIAKEAGILKSGSFVERTGNDMNFTTRVIQAFEEATGGVLFIDEAYGLICDNGATALIREMEAHRGDVIVIMAGYKDRMKHFLEMNEGFKSRIPYVVDFPDYSPEELLKIWNYILKQDGYFATTGAQDAALEILEKASRIKDFGNGRYARNLAEKSTLNMSVRLAKKYDGKDIPVSLLYKVLKEDVYIPDDPVVNCNNGEKKPKAKPGDEKTARQKLEEMIGLESAKKMIEGAICTFKMQKRLKKKGVDIGRNTMHMVFTGNPGTAKTTVARLVAQILKDEGVLSSGVFVEAGRGDLVGQFVGHTAPKVKKKFEDAMGGVLFIDEAYSLNDGNHHGSFGDEAINTIVQEMDNRRDDIIVIFAGYPDEMKEFIERNPGMSSRIASRIHFEDYSVEELCEITRYQVSEKHLKITDEAISKLVPIYEDARRCRTYGNGRYVRRAVELAISNLAIRLDKMDEKDLTDKVMTTIEAVDIEAPELDDEDTRSKRRIGFVA